VAVHAQPRTVAPTELDERPGPTAEAVDAQGQPLDCENVTEGAADDDIAGQDLDTDRRRSPARMAIAVGLVIAAVLAALAGWLGMQAWTLHRDQQQRDTFVAVGRQAALNLTTINYQHVDTDIKRILDSASGPFLDEFSKRSQPFMEVVKRAQSVSVGTVTAAGLESDGGDTAEVLVAVSVRTTSTAPAEQEPRLWRMRISLQQSGNQTKVTEVRFVP